MTYRSKCDFQRCEKFECCNNEKNHCVALITIDFGGKPCPFYKTRGQARLEKIECIRRNTAKTAKDDKELAELTEEVADDGKT